MYRDCPIRWPFVASFLMVLLGTVFQSRVAGADDSSKAIKEAPQTEVVMLVSQQLFDDLTQDSVDLHLDIDEAQEGVRVTGESNAVAQTSINLQVTPQDTVMEIRIAANAETDLKIAAGPATADARSSSTVVAQRMLSFDGVEFRAGEIEVNGQSQTRLLRVCSRRGGLIGRVVRRVAGQQLSKERPRINREVNGNLEDFARQEVARMTDDLIVELNQTTPLEETIMTAFPETKDWVYHVAKMDDYIRADAGPRNARQADLPDEAGKSNDVPIEVWIHLRPAEEVMANLLLKWNRSHDLLKQFLPEAEAALLAEDVSYDMIESWLRIQVGEPAVERVLTEQS